MVLATRPVSREAMLVVELVGDAPPSAPPDDDGASGVMEHPSGPAPAAVAALEAERDELATQLGSETEARARLGDEVAALTAANLALTDAIAHEQRRAAQLEQSLAAQRAEAEGARRELEQTYDALLAALREEIAQRDVALRRTRDGMTVSIVDRVLFPSGEAGLSAEGRDVIDKVAGVLATTTPERIVIEGHTDDVPIGPALRARFPSNWELSPAPATSVVRRLVTRGVAPHALEAIGRADTRPVVGNDTEAGRRRNRRIEIVLPPPTSRPAGEAEPDS